MSPLRGHRKSHSTSALSTLSDHAPRRKLRASQHPNLGRVEETTASMAQLPGLSLPGTRGRGREDRDNGKGRAWRWKSNSRGARREEEVRGWLNDAMSIRSSDRRRLAALRELERTLLFCCERGKHPSASEGVIALSTFVGLEVHTTLINLLTRHAQTLCRRHSSIPTGDEVLAALLPELSCIVGTLQGLCVLSKRCKEAVGEPWVLEIFINLLLLLRTQPAPNPPTPQEESGADRKPIACCILDLLVCALVDSPSNARTFERLSGLEAVPRVLKGTGVCKEVRMKCLEFLYFYLLPEEATPSRAVFSSSSSSSSSSESQLFPPSPVSSTSSNGSDGRISPSPNVPRSPSKREQERFTDLDIPFVPQTPRKPVQPNLGYLTPSTTRRVSGPLNLTPSLPPVSASTREMSKSPSKRHLIVEQEQEVKTIAKNDSRRWSVVDTKSSSSSINPGLGLGLPKSSRMISGLSTVTSQRDVTAIKLDKTPPSLQAPNFTDPFSSDSRSTSGASTLVPSPSQPSILSGLSRSSTQPSLFVLASSPRQHTSRRPSIRRVSRSPLVQSMTPYSPEVPNTQSHTPQVPRPPKMRHSRTQSHLSSLPPPAPPVPPLLRIAGSPNLPQSPPARRAFPAELTKGLPSSISSPILSSPLAPSRRIPSDKPPLELRPEEKRERGKEKDVKSVEEKKELLGEWLGNVEALVQGVEKVSFWESIGKARRERS